MNIVFFGTPHFAVPSLEKLIQHPDINVAAVVTQPDKKRGRGSQLIPSPVKTIALQHNLPVWQPRRVKKDAETLNKLKQKQADAFIVVAYGQILSQEILDMPRLGCINGHGSILPKYRGAAPIQWSIVNGESETGITTMLMDAGMDTGPMLLKATTPIHLLDNAANLADRLSEITANLLIETLLKLEQQTITPESQDSSKATYAPLIQKEDYIIDWSHPAFTIHNQIRGFYPNCITTIEKQMLKVKASIPLDPLPEFPLPDKYRELQHNNKTISEALKHHDYPFGTIVEVIKNSGPVVLTGNGLLLLLEVQLSGRRSQSGWDFINGTRIECGTRLGEF
jgi:methionyl-tRNA formyltransferase